MSPMVYCLEHMEEIARRKSSARTLRASSDRRCELEVSRALLQRRCEQMSARPARDGAPRVQLYRPHSSDELTRSIAILKISRGVRRW
jgi:hypothetical protein